MPVCGGSPPLQADTNALEAPALCPISEGTGGDDWCQIIQSGALDRTTRSQPNSWYQLPPDDAGRGSDLPGLAVAVAHHDLTPALVALIDKLGYVGPSTETGPRPSRQTPPRLLSDVLATLRECSPH